MGYLPAALYVNYIDFETFNDVPIKHGTYKYTSTCEAMICTYAFGEGPVGTWDITADKNMPYALQTVLEDEDELLCAHSSMFDRNVLKYALGMNIPIHRWRDTLVKAHAHGLPGGLDILCQILGVPDDKAKHKEGKKLIQLFCKPQPAGRKITRATRETHPEEWQRFLNYAASDVEAMREVDKKLPEWNYRGSELALWHLDQKINDRGMFMDTGLAHAAIVAAAKEQKRLAHKTQDHTGYDGQGEGVESATKRDVLLAHILDSYGIALPDMQKATLERRIADPDIPEELKELLRLRLSSTSTSTAKYKALIEAVMPDGRLRGALQFNGAMRTRRHAGRKFQPQNMPRPDMTNEDINFGIDCIKAGIEDLVYG